MSIDERRLSFGPAADLSDRLRPASMSPSLRLTLAIVGFAILMVGFFAVLTIRTKRKSR